MKIKKINYNKSKKGILLSETAKIVLAVCCIVLLAYLAVKLYSIFTIKNELEQARGHLRNIAGIVEELQKNDATQNQKTYLLLNPTNWALTGWPINSGGEMYNVPYCVSKNWNKCICMCEIDTSLFGKIILNNVRPSKISESCDLNKICFEIKTDILKINPSDNAWSLFEGSNLRPIYIKRINEDFEGNLLISYNKTTKELSIVPQKIQ
jgi:hypothetical protein